MKTYALLAAAGLFLALGAIAGACKDGGAGALTLEEYFQKVDAIGDDADARFSAQESAAGPDADASEDEIAAFARDNIEETASIFRDAGAALDELDPPAEVEEAHKEFVAALGPTADAIQAIAGDLPDTLSMAGLEQLDSVFDTPALDAAFTTFDATCAALQSIADGNGVDVDMEC